MPDPLEPQLHTILDFDRIIKVETIQSLWSGYGSLDRVILKGYEQEAVIVKDIRSLQGADHPRGWNSDVGHQRKLRSYEVEAHWYQHFNHKTDDACRTPSLLGYTKFDDRTLLVLEDLDVAGYHLRKQTLNENELHACLDWLATFHARFIGDGAEGLWPIGTYWQLDTRQSEWAAMPNSPLKNQAKAIHQKLNAAQFQTLVHGDAKYANFCFSPTGEVAAVDFQYVGKGCGIKDVAYLLSCIEGGIRDQKQEARLLDRYFSTLRDCLRKDAPGINFSALETEWQVLYPFAWADFERFLQGWAPGHWKSTAYAQEQVAKTFSSL
ncbi:MAG: DUF1679 domain-containing protein [Salibacteraceae bacterium]